MLSTGYMVECRTPLHNSAVAIDDGTGAQRLAAGDGVFPCLQGVPAPERHVSGLAVAGVEMCL